MRLYLDLPAKLVLDPGFEQLLLLEDLDGHDVARPLLSREVHRPEFAPPQWAADLEVAHGPVLPLPRRRPHAARAAAAAAAVGAAVPGGAATSPPSPFPRLLELDTLRSSARRGLVLDALRAPLSGRVAVVGVVALQRVCRGGEVGVRLGAYVHGRQSACVHNH